MLARTVATSAFLLRDCRAARRCRHLNRCRIRVEDAGRGGEVLARDAQAGPARPAPENRRSPTLTTVRTAPPRRGRSGWRAAVSCAARESCAVLAPEIDLVAGASTPPDSSSDPARRPAATASHWHRESADGSSGAPASLACGVGLDDVRDRGRDVEIGGLCFFDQPREFDASRKPRHQSSAGGAAGGSLGLPYSRERQCREAAAAGSEKATGEHLHESKAPQRRKSTRQVSACSAAELRARDRTDMGLNSRTPQTLMKKNRGQALTPRTQPSLTPTPTICYQTGAGAPTT